MVVGTWAFWRDTLERAIATAAEAAFGVWVTLFVLSVESLQVVAMSALIAAGATILKCLAATRVGDARTPALVDTEPEPVIVTKDKP